jgi:hypothetical protein
MKYIDNPQLAKLSQALSHDGPECTVRTRIEAYSCKHVKRDKRLIKTLEASYAEDVAHSPPGPSWLADEPEGEMTPFGPIDNTSSRKTLYLLIATLNIAFPDYEFSEVRPSHFARESSGAEILNALSTTLVAPHTSESNARTYYAYPPTSPDLFPKSFPSSSSPFDRPIRSPYAAPPLVSGTHPTLYRTIDDAIGLSECQVYSYNPDIDSDPNANEMVDDDELASLPDDDDSPYESDDDRGIFDFDDYDVDETSPSTSPARDSATKGRLPPSPGPRSGMSQSWPSISKDYVRPRHRGALLWSSHWFFLNRKLKRILFVSVWARASGVGRMWSADDLRETSKDSGLRGERFFGWEGGAGAGARALGLV